MRTLVPGSRMSIVNGVEVPLPEWPASVDGIRFGALERRGRLLVMRVAFDDHDVVLGHPVVLDPARHLVHHFDFGRREDAAVALLSDELAERVLDDILDANPWQTNAIALVVNRVNQVRRAARERQ